MSLFGRNPACKSLFAHSSPIFPHTTCQWCQFSPTWVLCVESTLILAFTPQGVHSCWDATLLRLPAGEGPLLPSIAFLYRVLPCAFPSVCGVLNSLLSRLLHIFTRSMSPLFTQTQVPTHYTFRPKAMCYMISTNSTFCPYPANLPVHFHIWQSTHL